MLGYKGRREGEKAVRSGKGGRANERLKLRNRDRPASVLPGPEGQDRGSQTQKAHVHRLHRGQGAGQVLKDFGRGWVHPRRGTAGGEQGRG